LVCVFSFYLSFADLSLLSHIHNPPPAHPFISHCLRCMLPLLCHAFVMCRPSLQILSPDQFLLKIGNALVALAYPALLHFALDWHTLATSLSFLPHSSVFVARNIHAAAMV
jgi:hypothetical protein